LTSRLFKIVLCFAIFFPSVARADDVEDARSEFLRGAELVKKSQWAEALAAFEQANKLRPHAVTTYNIGACQRAMGQYTRARETFLRSLAQNDAAQKSELPESLATDTKGFVTEMDGLLATVTITLEPATAAVTFDGRPLVVEDAAAKPPLLAAGVRPAGAGEPPPAATFRVRMDPGSHVMTFTRKGYSDAVVNKTFAPGSSTILPMKLDTLPATIHIASAPSGAVVTVAGTDVGLTPVDVLRPSGSYRVELKKTGFIPFDTQITAHAGEEVNIGPQLPVEHRSITTRWWFWTAIGVVVVGAVVGTALGVTAAQPAMRPEVNGGGLGWKVPVN